MTIKTQYIAPHSLWLVVRERVTGTGLFVEPAWVGDRTQNGLVIFTSHILAVVYAHIRNKYPKEAKLQQQYDQNLDMSKAIVPQSIPGLKVHIGSLVAPDSPPDNWMPVYIHSKIMIVDDVFLTHGSANCNRRSMEVDSELNICHERMDVTQPLRRHLWNIHTNGLKGAMSDLPEVAARGWENIISWNASNQKNGMTPVASLVGFMWTSAGRLRLD